MNSAMYRDIKSIFINRSYFCTSTMNYQKEKLRKISHGIYQQKLINYLGIDLTSKRPVLRK